MGRPPSSLSRVLGLAAEGPLGGTLCCNNRGSSGRVAKNLKLAPISLLAAPNLLEMPPHVACDFQAYTMPLPIAPQAGRVITEFQ